MATKKDTAEKAGNKLTVVKFIKSSAPYNKGEIAGFNADIAYDLIEKKVAVKHDGE